MAKQTRHKPPAVDTLIGKIVRIKGYCEVISRHPAAASVPERVSVKVGGILTVVPVSEVEIVR